MRNKTGLDRTWVKAVTGQIAIELERVNHSKISWKERTMIWKGRSLVYAEKQRQAGEALVKPTYAESVLAARRLRAGWEFMGQEQPKGNASPCRRLPAAFRNP